MSPCHHVTMSPCHPSAAADGGRQAGIHVTVSPCHHVTMSPVGGGRRRQAGRHPCHHVTMSPCHHVMSPCHPSAAADSGRQAGIHVTMSPCHHACATVNHPPHNAISCIEPCPSRAVMRELEPATSLYYRVTELGVFVCRFVDSEWLDAGISRSQADYHLLLHDSFYKVRTINIILEQIKIQQCRTLICKNKRGNFIEGYLLLVAHITECATILEFS